MDIKAKTLIAALAVVAAVLSLGASAKGASASVELITLGTIAGPVPTVDRAQTSTLLIVNGRYYLVDAGANAARRVAQAGVSVPRIDNVFITHQHSDHTAGLPFLLSTAWYYGRSAPMHVYGPVGTEALVAAALAFDAIDATIRHGAQTNSLDDIVEARNVEPGRFYSDGNLTVTAVENSHYHFAPDSPAYGKFGSYSYRFDIKSGPSIVFTGDTGPSQAVAKLAAGADVLVSEALAIDEIRARRKKAGTWQSLSPVEQKKWTAHMLKEHITPEQAGKLAATAGVELLVLTHLSSSGVVGDDYQRFVDRAAKRFDGPIVAAKDLMKFDLSKPGVEPEVIDYLARGAGD